ncbi:copper-binding protein [Actomonas aquatica]|uniref:Copper-binding protein n=1 Tax=Actomonas aquatica TaxID=2866162 RepID=A0ABZ1C661_9BACT|nr:copper-binding protein [Opitutus sp. WL0086]WRQ86868.1 copper-binding protein [Opitutus sp. WL0086]
MKRSLSSLLFLLTGLLLAPATSTAACACGADQCTMACTCEEPTEATKPADAGHPLRGLVESVVPDRQALLVKHEEIHGVMGAMTMLLRVAPKVLNEVKIGDTITATLHRAEDNTWYLDDVTVVAKQ